MKMRRSLLVAGLVFSMSALVFATFFQSFEFDTSGWFNTTRVMSPAHGITSESGAFHAEDSHDGIGAFTRWGGYSKTFPPGGYTTTVDIYLDILPPYTHSVIYPYPNDTRFDWTSAVNMPGSGCAHRRDFVFNAGFYTDAVAPGAGPRFVISASNNAGRSNSFPKNPDRDPFTISVEGWYTFEHRFYAGTGDVLRVDLTIKDATTGAILKMWTLSDPSDVIGVTVGGNRYGWFATDEFPTLAFDTSALVGYQDYCVPPASTPGAKVTGGGWIEVGADKGTFGLTAQVKGAPPTASGNVTYHEPTRNVKSTAVTSVVMLSAQCAQIRGMAKVNNANPPIGFEVIACDMGEPGDQDTFNISMADGYLAGGTLQGGNIQVH